MTLKPQTVQKISKIRQELNNKNISFTEFNNGLHFRIFGKYEEIDYWPTSSKFISRNTNRIGFGLKELLTIFKNEL